MMIWASVVLRGSNLQSQVNRGMTVDGINDSGCKSDWSMKSRRIGCFSAKLIVMLLAAKNVKRLLVCFDTPFVSQKSIVSK